MVAQPTHGLLLEKGFYRLAGSVVGALVGLAILALPADPFGHLGLLSLWVGVGSGATRTFRATHAYGGLLGGITAAIVVLPTVLAPLLRDAADALRGCAALLKHSS